MACPLDAEHQTIQLCGRVLTFNSIHDGDNVSNLLAGNIPIGVLHAASNTGAHQCA